MSESELLSLTHKQRLLAQGKERRHFKLSTEQWEDLDAVCAELGLLSPSFNKGQPSIGALLRGIADRQLVVLPDPEPPAMTTVVDERMARTRNRKASERLNRK